MAMHSNAKTKINDNIFYGILLSSSHWETVIINLEKIEGCKLDWLNKIVYLRN